MLGIIPALCSPDEMPCHSPSTPDDIHMTTRSFAAAVCLGSIALLYVPTTQAAKPLMNADLPLLKGSCPTGITFTSDANGFKINGSRAAIKWMDISNFDAKSGYITISVTTYPDKSPDVFYSGKGRANGVCAVTK